mmetsp:Transcript_13354/g.31196  ORF Transcript_13354/g.31196 Transcript_13354/m.31196 type:complete len:236 (+) Transcript_13354:50-757(+)
MLRSVAQSYASQARHSTISATARCAPLALALRRPASATGDLRSDGKLVFPLVVGHEGRPVELLRINHRAGVLRCELNELLLDHVLRHADNVLPVYVFEQADLLQDARDVVGHDRSLLANVHDRELALLAHIEDLEHLVRPVAAVCCVTKVGERLLRRAHFEFLLRQLVRERDKETPVPFPLVAREREDACKVVTNVRELLLRVESGRVKAALVVLAHDVEQERIDVIVERLVVEK